MGKTLEALLHLQSTQLDLVHVQKRLRFQTYAVSSQEQNIQKLQDEYDQLHEKSLKWRSDADRHDLEFKTKDEHIQKLRAALNTAKTNKEYAAFLTEINSFKADNAKNEELTLKLLSEVDEIAGQLTELLQQIDQEKKSLEEIVQRSKDEIVRLTGLSEEITAKRTVAAEAVPPDALKVFERIAEGLDGEAMAPIETHGKKPPFEFVCGGCFMTLNAEHANALQVRDEIRLCNNCGRILYMEQSPEQSRT